MSIVVANRFLRPGLVVAVAALVILSTGRGLAQREGSRPIEFSEPRDQSARGENAQGFGAEQRRLTDLEDRLSKAFSFFDTDDSMSGVPVQTLPRRAPVTVKRSKPSGLFDDPDQESSTDALNRLMDSLNSSNPSDSPFGAANKKDPGSGKVNLLNSLNTDDWLVKGMMRDSYFGIPVAAKDNSVDASKLNTLQPWERGSIGVYSHADRTPRIESFSGADRFFSSPSGRSPDDRFVAGGTAYELGQPVRTSEDVHIEEYRALLGLAPKPGMSQPSTVAGVVSPGSFPEPRTRFFSGFEDLRTVSPRTLRPVRSPERSSLYPTAPTAPKRPSAFDPIGNQVPVTSSPSSGTLLGSPFYEPLRRQF